MSPTLHCQCKCGQVDIGVRLTQAISQYVPRACDCDYCRAKDAAYLSDPHGEAQITSEAAILRFRQGSQQADFLVCPGCDQLVAVTCEIDGQLRGAINARLFSGVADLPAAQPASPKRLSADAKKARWAKIWFPVEVTEP